VRPARLRLRFTKLGKIRWTSHRDTARAWERAFRKVGLPLAYSGGFSPRPRLSFGLALPTGCESEAEYLDVELADAPDPRGLEQLRSALSLALPQGVEVTAAAFLPPGAPSLQEEVVSCSWRWLVVAVAQAGPDHRAAELLRQRALRISGAKSLVVALERKGEITEEDIGPAVVSLRVLEPQVGCYCGGDLLDPHLLLEAELTTRPRSIRPADLTPAFGGGVEHRLVRRTRQWIWRDGARLEPLPLECPAGATRPTHAVGCAL